MISRKTFIGMVIVVVLITVVGCSSPNPTTTVSSTQVSKSANLRAAEIDLPGMFCQACAQSSTEAFKGMQGVVSAKVDIKTKKGNVVYDANIISKEQLAQHSLIQAYDGKILSDQEYTPT